MDNGWSIVRTGPKLKGPNHRRVTCHVVIPPVVRGTIGGKNPFHQYMGTPGRWQLVCPSLLAGSLTDPCMIYTIRHGCPDTLTIAVQGLKGASGFLFTLPVGFLLCVIEDRRAGGRTVTGMSYTSVKLFGLSEISPNSIRATPRKWPKWNQTPLRWNLVSLVWSRPGLQDNFSFDSMKPFQCLFEVGVRRFGWALIDCLDCRGWLRGYRVWVFGSIKEPTRSTGPTCDLTRRKYLRYKMIQAANTGLHHKYGVYWGEFLNRNVWSPLLSVPVVVFSVCRSCYDCRPCLILNLFKGPILILSIEQVLSSDSLYSILF